MGEWESYQYDNREKAVRIGDQNFWTNFPRIFREEVGTIPFGIQIEEPTPEKFLIQNMQQIPEVESIYQLNEEDEITIYTIISNKRYNKAVNMQVYKVEYNMMEAYPEVNIDFHCLPRLGFTDQEFLPSEVVKIYERI